MYCAPIDITPENVAAWDMKRLTGQLKLSTLRMKRESHALALRSDDDSKEQYLAIADNEIYVLQAQVDFVTCEILWTIS